MTKTARLILIIGTFLVIVSMLAATIYLVSQGMYLAAIPSTVLAIILSWVGLGDIKAYSKKE